MGKIASKELEIKIQTAKENSEPGQNYTVTYHSDETLGINHETYQDSNKENWQEGHRFLL